MEHFRTIANAEKIAEYYLRLQNRKKLELSSKMAKYYRENENKNVF